MTGIRARRRLRDALIVQNQLMRASCLETDAAEELLAFMRLKHKQQDFIDKFRGFYSMVRLIAYTCKMFVYRHRIRRMAFTEAVKHETNYQLRGEYTRMLQTANKSKKNDFIAKLEYV